MKQINPLFLVSGILALLLVIGSSLVTFKSTSALALNDIAKFSVVEQREDKELSLVISGLNTNSSQCVSGFLTTTESQTLVVLLKTKLSDGKCSGSFSYTIPVSNTVGRVAIGNDSSIVWERTLHPYTNEKLGFSLLIPYTGSNETPIKVRDSEVDGIVAVQYDIDIYGLRGGWSFIVAPVPSEADLGNIITDRIFPPNKYDEYDDSELCRIRKIIPTKYPDTFTVTFLEDSKKTSSDTTPESCGSVSRSWIIKYSPTLKKVAFIYIGEGNSYSLTRNGHTVVYDSIMADSFHFLPSKAF